MLATLQRIITFALLAAGLTWTTLSLQAGHALWALAGTVVILAGHALVLALEFVLSRVVSRRAGDAVPRVRSLLRAWWHETHVAPRVFLWRQPFFSGRWPDRLPAGRNDAGGRAVLFVHGFVCNRGLWNHWLRRLDAAGVPFVAVNLEPVFGSIDHYVPIIESAVSRLEAAGCAPPVVVAHSMGGLAVRRWWAEAGNAGRLHHLLTLATPHHGTWLARFAFVTNGRQMRLSSPWRTALEQREDPALRRRLTCFYSDCDNIVFPVSSAALAGADCRLLRGVAHVEMVDRPEPYDELLRLLSR